MPRTFRVLLLVLPAIALAEGPPAAAPAEAPRAGPDLARLDELYMRRGEPAAAGEEERLLADAVKAFPDDPEVLWRQARWISWKADDLGEGEIKKKLGKEIWALGDKVARLRPAMAEGYYYGALGVAQYSQGAGILNALAEGLEGKFNQRLDKSIQLDASLDGGGPMSTKGRYFFELPWFLRNLGKSAEWLNRCLAKHPESLRARLYLAETLRADGKVKEAKAQIDQVMNGGDAYDPAEAARIKARGKKVQAEIEKELR